MIKIVNRIENIRKVKQKGLIQVVITTLLSVFICMNSSLVQTKAESSEINTEEIDKFMKSKLDDEGIPGASIGIVKDNKIIYLKGYGKADENGTAVTEKTPFILGSVSKSFTSLAIMQLKEDGKIDIDAPVQKYLPWFELKDKDAAGKITVRNLLTHSSGLSNMKDFDEFMNDDMSIETFVRNLKNTDITKPVGSEFQYSNIGYDILGEIIQEVSGISYSEYIQKNIFSPLDMKKSYTSQDEAKQNGLATGYFSCFMLKIPFNQRSHTANLPCGYIISTAEDMCHYLIAQMNNGSYSGSTVLDKENLNEMHKQSVHIGSEYYYGMGWVNDNKYIWHNGESENFSSELFMRKSDNLGLVMLFNKSDNMRSYDYIAHGVLQILSGEEVTSSTPISFRLLINILAVIFTILSLLQFKMLIHWIKKFNLKAHKSLKSTIPVIVFNLIIPLLICLFVEKVICYKIYESPLLWMPDLVYSTMVLPITIFIIGLIKISFIITSMKRRKS